MEKTPHKLTTDRFKSAEYVRNVFAVTPSGDTPFGDLLKPEYWAHIAAQLHITDRLEVIPEDGTFFAELIVTSVSRNSASVRVLRKIDLAGSKEVKTPASDFDVRHCGIKAKFRITRKSDKAIIKEGFDTYEQANNYLTEYLKTVELV